MDETSRDVQNDSLNGRINLGNGGQNGKGAVDCRPNNRIGIVGLEVEGRGLHRPVEVCESVFGNGAESGREDAQCEPLRRCP